LSNSDTKAPPWMTPEDGDEHGKKLAEEVARQKAEETADDTEFQVSDEVDATAPASPDAAPDAEPRPDDEIARLTEELNATKDRMLRIAADFENFRKRARREQDESLVRGREQVLKDVIAVMDNLERAIASANEHTGPETTAAIVQGVTMVLRQFADSLGRFELKQFSALGSTFDPNFHEAVAQVESQEHAPGAVVLEYQKGYMLGQRLMRPAMVVVASPSSRAAEPETSEAPEKDEPSPEDVSTNENHESATVQMDLSELAQSDPEKDAE